MVSEGSENACILFADIVGSTRLYETVGDVEAYRQIGHCFAAVTDIIETNSGEVIQTIGDELMCRFSDADSAVKAACEIQELLDEKGPSDRPRLQMRIGMQYGPVGVKGEDLFGDTINVAARMVGIAKARQIFTTEQTVAQLSSEHRRLVRAFDRIPVKGKQEDMMVYQVIWEQDVQNVTNVMPVFSGPEAVATSLRLRYRDQEKTLEPGSRPLTIGRKQCDITVPSLHASRTHAQVEYRRGKFVLVDLSTNGTYVKLPDGTEVYLHREELMLSGSGIMGIGKPLTDENAQIINYECK